MQQSNPNRPKTKIFAFHSFQKAWDYQNKQGEEFKKKYPRMTSNMGIYTNNGKLMFSVSFKLQ